MGSLPVLKPREVAALLARLGFQELRQRGSHRQYRHPDGRARRSHSIQVVTFHRLYFARSRGTSVSPLENFYSAAEERPNKPLGDRRAAHVCSGENEHYAVPARG
jgi:predicted RNA binding protein YcfA (HicA-like mRNA interferase family)